MAGDPASRSPGGTREEMPRVAVTRTLQAQAVTAATATPARALAACAACSPVTRHALVPAAPPLRKRCTPADKYETLSVKSWVI